MTDAGDKLIEGAKEALAVAKGEIPAARIHLNGFVYVPFEESLVDGAPHLTPAMVDKTELDESMRAANGTRSLVAKAKALVDMLDDAERNQGGLVGKKTLTCANELRLELSRWK